MVGQALLELLIKTVGLFWHVFINNSRTACMHGFLKFRAIFEFGVHLTTLLRGIEELFDIVTWKIIEDILPTNWTVIVECRQPKVIKTNHKSWCCKFMIHYCALLKMTMSYLFKKKKTTESLFWRWRLWLYVRLKNQANFKRMMTKGGNFEEREEK